jgi:hypothetical protein
MRSFHPTRVVAVLALFMVGCSALQPAAPGVGRPVPPAGGAACEVGYPSEQPSVADGAVPSDAATGVANAVVDEAAGLSEPSTPAALLPSPLVWGRMELRGYALGQTVAPNGLAFKPLFSLDMNVNVWLWREEKVYAFTDTRFWGQRAAPGITNPSQGAFDFSKREFDLDLGLAWNYYGPLEARTFAYSFNNLNRGNSPARPSGYNDGVGLENRWYIGGTYQDLGQPGFDVARASFLSLGLFPTKDMTDADGNLFKPGPFARASLIWEVLGERCYLYLDGQFIAKQSFTPKLLNIDGGVAVRPFRRLPYFEVRVGSENRYDVELNELVASLYVAVQFVF